MDKIPFFTELIAVFSTMDGAMNWNNCVKMSFEALYLYYYVRATNMLFHKLNIQ